MRIWDGKNSDPGSGMEKSRIRDPEKHPGSATLAKMIWSDLDSRLCACTRVSYMLSQSTLLAATWSSSFRS
jgi:hypothetical protein